MRVRSAFGVTGIGSDVRANVSLWPSELPGPTNRYWRVRTVSSPSKYYVVRFLVILIAACEHYSMRISYVDLYVAVPSYVQTPHRIIAQLRVQAPSTQTSTRVSSPPMASTVDHVSLSTWADSYTQSTHLCYLGSRRDIVQ